MTTIRSRLPEETVYLSYNGDPATTMTISWHTKKGTLPSSFVEYREKGSSDWVIKRGTSKEYTQSDAPFYHYRFYKLIHHVELSELEPDTEYEFRLYEEVHTFKTMPTNPTEIKIALGGDYQANFARMGRMASTVASFEPDFHAIIGDLASCDGFLQGWRWEPFWKAIAPELKRTDGNIIPIMAGIGNHEVTGGFTQDPNDAPYFYPLFNLDKSYRYVDFGDLLRLIILDSHLTERVDNQTDWLKQAIESSNHDHIIPCQHVSGYPSSRNPNDGIQTLIRNEWYTEYEKENNVRTIFEGHEHCYQRSNEMPNKTRYFGGGPLSISPRVPVHPDERDYLEETKGNGRDAENAHHFYLVTANKESIRVESINIEGVKFHDIIYEDGEWNEL